MFLEPVSNALRIHFQVKVASDPDRPFLYIPGKCKSRKCNNEFQAIAKKEPNGKEDLRLLVKCRDTRLENHEVIVRQLRHQKRKVIGEKVLKEGAANCRRNIAKDNIQLGDVNSPIL